MLGKYRVKKNRIFFFHQVMVMVTKYALHGKKGKCPTVLTAFTWKEQPGTQDNLPLTEKVMKHF